MLTEYRLRGDGVARRLAEAVALGSDQIIELIADTPDAVKLLQVPFREVRFRRIDIGAHLRARFPTVTVANLDEAVAYLRALLAEELAKAGEGGEVELI